MLLESRPVGAAACSLGREPQGEDATHHPAAPEGRRQFLPDVGLPSPLRGSGIQFWLSVLGLAPQATCRRPYGARFQDGRFSWSLRSLRSLLSLLSLESLLSLTRCQTRCHPLRRALRRPASPPSLPLWRADEIPASTREPSSGANEDAPSFGRRLPGADRSLRGSFHPLRGSLPLSRGSLQ